MFQSRKGEQIMKSIFEQMGGKYIQIGDYYVHDFGQFDDEQGSIDNRPIGKYEMLRESFLKERHNPLYNHLLLSGELSSHLRDVEEESQKLLDLLMPQYKVKFEITEELKSTNQMEWIKSMNMAISIAEEIIFNEIIYQ